MTTNKTPSILAKALKTISISYLACLLIAGFIEFGLLAALLLIVPLITFIYKKTHNNTNTTLLFDFILKISKITVIRGIRKKIKTLGL